MISTSEEAKEYMLKQYSQKPVGEYIVADITIEEEKDIDGHKLWRYFLHGIPVPATRNEQWIRDDGEKYGITSCFEHTIEQVMRGEVKGPFHNHEDHE